MTDQEKIRYTRDFLQLLIDGVDPQTGRPVPEGEVLLQKRVNGCLRYTAGLLDQMLASDRPVRVKRPIFSITPEQLERYRPLPYACSLSEFCRSVTALADETLNMRQLSTRTVTDWLLDSGLLESVVNEGAGTQRLPTEAGEALGITVIRKTGLRGIYRAVVYSPDAQQFLADNLPAILAKRDDAAKSETDDASDDTEL